MTIKTAHASVHLVGSAIPATKHAIRGCLAKNALKTVIALKTTPNLVIGTMESAFARPATTQRTVLLMTKSSRAKVS